MQRMHATRRSDAAAAKERAARRCRLAAAQQRHAEAAEQQSQLDTLLASLLAQSEEEKRMAERLDQARPLLRFCSLHAQLPLQRLPALTVTAHAQGCLGTRMRLIRAQGVPHIAHACATARAILCHSARPRQVTVMCPAGAGGRGGYGTQPGAPAGAVPGAARTRLGREPGARAPTCRRAAGAWLRLTLCLRASRLAGGSRMSSRMLLFVWAPGDVCWGYLLAESSRLDGRPYLRARACATLLVS